MNRIVKVALAVAFASAASSATAADYSDAVAKQSKCESAGELAKSFHGSTTEELRSSAKELDKQARAKKISTKLADATKYVMFMGKTAKSPKDAYMLAWGWCMDQK
jgi:protein-tyrosine-phosphatase